MPLLLWAGFSTNQEPPHFFILKFIRVVTGKQCHNDTYIQYRYPKRDVKENRNVSTFSKKQQRTCFTSEARRILKFLKAMTKGVHNPLLDVSSKVPTNSGIICRDQDSQNFTRIPHLFEI